MSSQSLGGHMLLSTQTSRLDRATMRHFDKLSASHGRPGQVNINALPVRGRVVRAEFGEERTKATVTLRPMKRFYGLQRYHLLSLRAINFRTRSPGQVRTCPACASRALNAGRLPGGYDVARRVVRMVPKKGYTNGNYTG